MKLFVIYIILGIIGFLTGVYVPGFLAHILGISVVGADVICLSVIIFYLGYLTGYKRK